MDVAPSLAITCPPRRAYPHSRLLIPLFRFLTSDFQFPFSPALSTCDVSTFDSSTFLPSRSLSPLEPMPMRRAPNGKSSGLKLFGISKCTARTRKSRTCKCPGMCALQKYAGLISFRISVCKNLGAPQCAAVENSGANGNEATAGGSRGLSGLGPWRFLAQSGGFAVAKPRPPQAAPAKLGDSGAGFRYNRARRTPAESAAWRSACNA
jgi:hypothetical protein